MKEYGSLIFQNNDSIPGNLNTLSVNKAIIKGLSKTIIGCFGFVPLRYWSRKLAPSSQPITLKTKSNRFLVKHSFSQFKQLIYFTLRSHGMITLVLILPHLVEMPSNRKRYNAHKDTTLFLSYRA